MLAVSAQAVPLNRRRFAATRLRDYNKTYGREYRFRKAMEREKRIDEIIAETAADIARLEKELGYEYRIRTPEISRWSINEIPTSR